MKTLFSAAFVAISTSFLVACAGTGGGGAARPASDPGTTTTTGAELMPSPYGAPGDEAAQAAPAPREAAPAAQAQGEPGLGDLVCRTKTVADGTTELYLTWSEGTAKGFVRNVAPSGMVYVKPIHAERYKSMIVVDGPSEPDLASHTAVVSKSVGTGKPFMRVGDHSNAWIACE